MSMSLSEQWSQVISVFSDTTIRLSLVFSIYTLYIVIYGLCIWVLIRRKSQGYRWHIVTTTLMFSLATVQVGVLAASSYFEITYPFFELLPDTPVMPDAISIIQVNLEYANAILNIMSCWLPDVVLIHRCYLIWGRNRKVVILPIILLICSIGNGALYLIYQPPIPFTFVSFLTTALVTGLSSGRIWWINRTASRLLGSHVQKAYQRAISLLLESGLLYSLFLLAFTIVSIIDMQTKVYGSQLTTALGSASGILLALLGQISGLLPTLMIVLVGLKLGVDMDAVVNSMAPDNHHLGRQKVSVDAGGRESKRCVHEEEGSDEMINGNMIFLDIRRLSSERTVSGSIIRG